MGLGQWGDWRPNSGDQTSSRATEADRRTAARLRAVEGIPVRSKTSLSSAHRGRLVPLASADQNAIRSSIERRGSSVSATTAEETFARWLMTEWRPGSRRAFAHCLHQCVMVRSWSASLDLPPNETAAAGGSEEYDLEWFTTEALAAGYISVEQAAILEGPDVDAAHEVIRSAIWDWAVDPAVAEASASTDRKNAAFDALVDDERGKVLNGPDEQARRALIHELCLDPSVASLPDPGQPDWSLDWPEGTPPDEAGPWRREVREFIRSRRTSGVTS